jgi:hypothetical protein
MNNIFFQYWLFPRKINGKKRQTPLFEVPFTIQKQVKPLTRHKMRPNVSNETREFADECADDFWAFLQNQPGYKYRERSRLQYVYQRLFEIPRHRPYLFLVGKPAFAVVLYSMYMKGYLKVVKGTTIIYTNEVEVEFREFLTLLELQQRGETLGKARLRKISNFMKSQLKLNKNGKQLYHYKY